MYICLCICMRATSLGGAIAVTIPAGTAELAQAEASTTQPYTLHPTPYALHPTPYTLHPSPFTLHPSPSKLSPAPQILRFQSHDEKESLLN